nr:poly-beta-1,6 N-acetyl-D-glucosamine export porin PgaA [Gammaproteobacteria bacterium]
PHPQAVEMARAGDAAGGADRLERLHKLDPNNQPLLADLIVVSVWADRIDRAISLSAKLPGAKLPGYALTTLAQGARDGRRFAEAARFYQRLVGREDKPEYHFKQVMTLAEAGEHQRARARISALASRFGRNANYHHAKAYAHRQAEQYVAAAGAYEDAVTLSPADENLRREQILNLADMGAPHLAVRLLNQFPNVLDASQRRRVLGDRAAMQIRWGEVAGDRPPTRFAQTDRALAYLDDIAVPSSASPASGIQRTTFDSMVALRDRVRMDEVVALYEKLGSPPEEIPTYAVLALADAFLYLEQPEVAGPLYELVRTRDPTHFVAGLSLFYTYVELERHAEAIALIDELEAQQPVWIKSQSEKIVKANPKRERAATLAGLARGFADDLGGAEQRLGALLRMAPLNADIESEVATVERWRGWPRRAYQRFHRIRAETREHLSADIGVAHTALDLQYWREAQGAIHALLADYPEHKGVQSLGRRLRHYRRPFMTFDWRVDESSGGTVSGTRGIDTTVRWWSAPIHDRYRITARHRFGLADFTEGRAVRNRGGIGIDYRDADWDAEVELNAGTHDHSQFGVSGRGRWTSDLWRVHGGWETASDEVPLRGARVGLDGRRVFVEAEFRAHESFSASVGAQAIDFDDGNERHAASASVESRVLNLPASKVSLRLDAYASLNDRDDVVYFSPKADWSVDLRAINDLRLYRRYERGVDLRWWLGAGRYWQDAFGTDSTWTAGAELRWRVGHDVLLMLGATRSSRVFDGIRERGDTVFGRIEVNL